MFLYLDCVPSPSESMWFSYAAIASATDLTRGAFGSSMAASFRIARCQSRVFIDCRCGRQLANRSSVWTSAKKKGLTILILT